MRARKDVFAINWMEVDALVKARHDDPHHILGMHECIDDLYVNALVPDAESVEVVDINAKKSYPMTADRVKHFYSVKIKNCKRFEYRIRIKYATGKPVDVIDPYMFESVIDPIDISMFNEGEHYEIYEKLGAHPMKVDGVEGTLFAVWAPNAERVSVVADFNRWDGRIHQMRRLPYSGIFEIFIPGVKAGEIYKYEVRSRAGKVQMKTDPYGSATELRPCDASIVSDFRSFRWNDGTWMKEREQKNLSESPMSVYEVYLGAWRRPTDGREFFNYREMAKMLAKYVKDMGYTHIELMPIMEHPYDPSWGYQITGYYAPTSRYGSPEDFMYFVNYMHKQGISVIIDWVPAHFPKDANGLGRFDGSCVYEHEDPRRGEHPHWGTYIFDYSKPEVKNFLIANALYWADKFHVDGIRVDAVASMLYLDYGRDFGNWLPNPYGGNENLDAIAFLKQLNTVMKEKFPGVAMIAEESTAWPMISHPVEEGGLGFDFKWNMGWMHDMLGYMELDPLYRKYHHNELTFSMVYAYSEKFILVLSHDEVVHEKRTMIGKMPGGYEDKFSNLRLTYGYMMTHPGKKLLFMGQEFAQFKEFNESDELDWGILEFDAHECIREYCKALNELYRSEPALYELDDDPAGFAWIDSKASNDSILTFARKGKDKKDTLIVVCNFTPVEHKNYRVGVPYEGSYKEIFTSEKESFGGEGVKNKTAKISKKVKANGLAQSISVYVAPLSIAVFKIQG